MIIKQTLKGNYKVSIDAEIDVPLKYLSIFLRTLDMPLINCEVSLIFTWSKDCVLTSKATKDPISTQEGNLAVVSVNNLTGATFKIKDTHSCMFQ